MSLVHRRRAIFTALDKFFSGDDRLKILGYWEQYFADKPSFALHQFISGFVDLCNPPVSRSEIFKEMTYQLMQPESKLLSDPIVELDRFRLDVRTKAQKEKEATATQYVFEDLLNRVFSKLRADKELTIRNFTAFELEQNGAHFKSSAAVIHWLNRDSALNVDDIDVPTLKHVVQVVYVALVEHFNEEQAENLMDSALHDVMKSPQAKIFSPHLFF